MPTVVLKLFAVQGTGRTDGQSSDYMLPPLGSIKIMPLYINISFRLYWCNVRETWRQSLQIGSHAMYIISWYNLLSW